MKKEFLKNPFITSAAMVCSLSLFGVVASRAGAESSSASNTLKLTAFKKGTQALGKGILSPVEALLERRAIKKEETIIQKRAKTLNKQLNVIDKKFYKEGGAVLNAAAKAHPQKPGQLSRDSHLLRLNTLKKVHDQVTTPLLKEKANLQARKALLKDRKARLASGTTASRTKRR